MSQWRVAIGEKQYGPYTLDKLREIYEEGRVPGDAQVWHPRRQQWIGAEDVSELTEARSQTAISEDSASIRFDAVAPSSAAPITEPKVVDDSLSDYLAFRRMITPIMIPIVFWIGAVVSSMAGIFIMINGIKYNDVGSIFLGFFTMLLGPIAVRIGCELLVVIFRMHETLTELHLELKSRGKL